MQNPFDNSSRDVPYKLAEEQKMMAMRGCLCVFGLVLASANLAVAQRGAPVAQPGGTQEQRENGRDNLPPGEGRELVAKHCAACHDLRGVVQLRQTPAKWEAVVFDMIGRGAPIFMDEALPIVDYLSKALGPDAPPLADVNSARREDLMKLPGISPERADRLIAHRSANGPWSSRDEVRAVLGLDERDFEKVKYYLRASAEPAKR